MSSLFFLSGAERIDPRIEAWFDEPHDELRRLAQYWFNQIRALGPDVVETIHDGAPTACVHDAAFAYVGAFKTHVNVGFFYGAALLDPARLFQGSGKRMRHTKLRWGEPVNAEALNELIASAYRDIHLRLSEGE